ncbi:ly6/PLAUR domain-containing protein 2-like isoform X3 [Siphateles boraxobius]|uniref:ly6/PLAUR domain-containing protein 2-like isoform X3 n=1 Tax=Siphateles boraxobius TaxID=180520 RepID=UPI0040641939
MNLQVSVVLLFISLTGGYSLKCYSCTLVTDCAKVETCAAEVSKCSSTKIGSSISFLKTTTKGCASECVSGTVTTAGVTTTTTCCDTDLCNGADGVYKGSFLLLVSPLLFYFLFQ